ncbi:MAG: family 16 glycosylhydrolase [Pseudomonadota bacterium]
MIRVGSVLSCCAILALCLASGCTPFADRYAINVGGEQYAATYGTLYDAEQYVTGGAVGEMATVKGSPEFTLFSTYREGDFTVRLPVSNDTYDVTFYFAEPHDVNGGERVFDVLAEGEIVIDNLDVMAFRDGKTLSALTIVTPDIVITDNELTIEFVAAEGVPLLNALSLQRKRPRTDEWTLVWQDEFDGVELNANNWTPNVWDARRVNDENQTYTARDKNLRVEDGYLVIEAHHEQYNNAEYTSGRIHSSGKADFLYGRIEVRAKLPSGQGTWPAIWMLSSDPFKYATRCASDAEWQGNPDCDAWPNSGEIDILEHVGYQMNHVHGTVHNKAYYWINWEQRKGRILLDDVDKHFHVYALEWSPERIDMFVNDSLYFTYINNHTDWQQWPFDHPFHLIMNIAVGGYWGRAGGPIDNTIFPQRMLVDYARVYRRN